MFHKKRKSRDSKKIGKSMKLDELVLQNAKLRFCSDQLQNLNYSFNKRLEQVTASSSEKALILARSVTERLVQRIVCGAGILDPRFSSKYLISDSNQPTILSNKLHYMIRLDSLSTPCLYKSDSKPKYTVLETESDHPPGYARIKLSGATLKIFGDYINANGYLRRDKVQARLVGLLAAAVSKDVPSSPLHVDESVHCGVPGKVVDSFTLHNILKTESKRHVYYGPGGNVPRFPDPRDFRLAIVDEPNGIRLKVEFLSPALSNITIDVRILVAIGIDAWPSSTDFPSRVSLGDSDCLLYHQAAQTGMYLVGYGVQSSAWQIRVPAAEFTILNHYGPNSTVRSVLDMLNVILEDINLSRKLRKQHISYKILTKYILFTILLEELEKNSREPVVDMICWSPLYLSTHVLRLLDKIITRLKSEKLPNYFFKNSNLLVNPGHLTDDDFAAEAGNVKSALLRYFDESLMSTFGDEEFDKFVSSQQSEMILLFKWKDLIDGLLPPSGTRGRRFCFAGSRNSRDVAHTQYTLRQLEYVGLLLKKMLIVKQNILHANYAMIEDSPVTSPNGQDTALEDVIFILVSIMDQARDQYLSSQTNPSVMKNRQKIKLNFNAYTTKLVDLMRRDRELLAFNCEDDLVLVKVILKWLYKAMDQNKRYLGPILRPYLSNLFSTSHAISWHIDLIKQRISNDELDALGSFAELVNSGKITPAQGLIDSVNKNWLWAKSMLTMVEKNTLRVIFISDRGKVYRHILSLPSYQKNSLDSGSKTLDSPIGKNETRRQKTLPNRSYFSTILTEKYGGPQNCIIPQHDYLRSSSPMSLVLSKKHRNGEHRGVGDIFKALASMQKLSVFQEVTHSLPHEDRLELAELVHSIQTSKTKRPSAKRWSGTIPQIKDKSKYSQKNQTVQRYIPKDESAGVKLEDSTKSKPRVPKTLSANSLIGTCRAVRTKEDSSLFYLQESFKIKAMLNNGDMFTC